MTTPLIKVWDMAYPRLQVPDLDKMETFLTNFGMSRALRTDDKLYMRGAGPAPFVHVSHLGDKPGFLGFAMQAASRADLDILAASEGFSPVEAIDEPGGGERVRITDPLGFEVEIVYGREEASALDFNRRPVNMGENFERLAELKRVNNGPARIKRFGHLQLNVPDIPFMMEWYAERFGFVASDVMHLDDMETICGVFYRCDRGDVPSDHHSLLFTRQYGGITGLNHVSWEVGDMDDVWTGHEHLRDNNYKPEWGIGRHLLGSQIFDYWNDPWGQIHEHWTDGDQLNQSMGTNKVGLEMAGNQWGPDMPDTYRRTSAPLHGAKEL